MSADQNLALVHRLFDEVNNKHNLAVADQLIAPDYVLHDPGNPNFSGGREGYKQFQTTFTQAFPDHQLTFDAQFAAGELVVTRWTSTGTQTGALLGVPATGKHVKVSGITISRIANGMVAEDWQEWDQLGLLRQLGVIPG
ncbi:MAG TPA: ester cyclase [Anaerolineae bacterium]|nr:ester cyclase [Anaerolineae bacterium]